MMVSSLPLHGQSPRAPKQALPSPYDAGLNGWLDRSMPFDQTLDDQHWKAFTPVRSQASYMPPVTTGPRPGSMQELNQQRNQLQQDTFQRRTQEATNARRVELELPQKDASLQSQLQQLSDGVKSFMRNLDRVNIVDASLREAAAVQVAATMEGRKQAQREGAKSLLERLAEIATATKTVNDGNALRKPKKENKRVEAIEDANTETEANLAVGEAPSLKEQ
jgi:hypothetical protein